uniref:Uncharacterized protein n=1 Tax=Plectus sambesii TaxID=2011161 RepID=A0A914WHM7_9BILA
FASSVKKIKNKPVKNEIISGDTMLRHYKNMVEQLTTELEAKNNHNDVKVLQTVNVELNQEVQRLRDQIEKIKHAILTGGHNANGDSSDTVRKSTARNPRRQTWCPGLGRRPHQSIGSSRSMIGQPMNESFEQLPASDLMRDFALRESTINGDVASPVAVPIKRSRNVAGFSSMLETVEERRTTGTDSVGAESAVTFTSEVESQLRERIAQLEKQLAGLNIPEEKSTVTRSVAYSGGRYIADPNLEETCGDDTVTSELLRTPCETPKSASNDARRRTVDVACGSATIPRTVLFGDPNLEQTAADDDEDTIELRQNETVQAAMSNVEDTPACTSNEDVMSEKLRELHEHNRDLQEQLANARALLESGVGDAIRAEIDRLIRTNGTLAEERDALAIKCDELEGDLKEKEVRLEELDAEADLKDARLEKLEGVIFEKEELLLRLEKEALQPPALSIVSETVAAFTQVGDHSLNESDDSSGNSRVPESMFDRSSSPDADMVQMCNNLLSEKELLECQLREAKRQYEILAIKLDNVQSQKQMLEQRLDERDQSYDALKSFQVHEQDILQRFTGSDDDLPEKILALEAQNAQLQQQVAELKVYQGEFDSLEDYIHWKKNAEDAEVMLRDIGKQLATCQSTFSEETRQHALLKEEYAKQTKTLENVRRDVADYEYMLEIERKSAQAKMRDLQASVTEMEAELNNWRTRANQFSEVSREQLVENEDIVGEKNAEIDQLQSEIANLQQRLDAMGAAVQETEVAKVEQLREASEKVDALQAAAVEDASTIDDLKQKLNELNARLAAEKSLEDRLAEAENVIEYKNEEIGQLSNDLTELQKQLDAKAVVIEDLTRAQTSNDSSERLAEKSAELAAVQRDLLDLQKQLATMDAALREAEATKIEELRLASEQLEQLRAAAASDSAVIAELNSQVEQLRVASENDNAMRVVAAENATKIEELNRQLERLQNATESDDVMRATSAEDAAAIAELQRQLSDLQGQLGLEREQSEALRAEFERQISEKNEQIEELANRSADLQQRLEAMTVAMEDADRLRAEQLRAVEEQSEQLRSATSSADAQTQQLAAQIEELNAQLSAAREDVAEKQAMIESLMRRKKQLEIECDKMDTFEEEMNAKLAAYCAEVEKLKADLAKAPSSQHMMEEVNELRANSAKMEAEKESHRLEANRLGMRAVGLERQLRSFEKEYKTKLTELQKEVAVKDERIRHLKDELRVASIQLQQQEALVLRASAGNLLQQRSVTGSTQSLNSQRNSTASTASTAAGGGSIVDNFLLHEERQKNYNLQKSVKELKEQLKKYEEMIQKQQGELLTVRRESLSLSHASLKENDEPAGSGQTPTRSALRNLPSLVRSSKKEKSTKMDVGGGVDAASAKITAAAAATPQRRTPASVSLDPNSSKRRDSPSNCRQQ